jgi:hypothetical protein
MPPTFVAQCTRAWPAGTASLFIHCAPDIEPEVWAKCAV